MFGSRAGSPPRSWASLRLIDSRVNNHPFRRRAVDASRRCPWGTRPWVPMRPVGPSLRRPPSHPLHLRQKKKKKLATKPPSAQIFFWRERAGENARARFSRPVPRFAGISARFSAAAACPFACAFGAAGGGRTRIRELHGGADRAGGARDKRAKVFARGERARAEPKPRDGKFVAGPARHAARAPEIAERRRGNARRAIPFA